MEVQGQAASLIWLWWGSTCLGHILVDGSMLEAWVKGRDHTLAGKPERVSLLVQAKHTLCRWATPPALSFLYQPLLEDWGRAPDFWGRCPSNLLTFTHCSKVGPLPLAPPPTWPVCCHHAPSWRENSIKGYVAKDSNNSTYRSHTGDQALNTGIFGRWTTSKPKQKKIIFLDPHLQSEGKMTYITGLWSVFCIVSVSFLLYGWSYYDLILVLF